MSSYTEEQVEEIVQEAVSRVERSFGERIKRWDIENKRLTTACDKAAIENEVLESSVAELVSELSEARALLMEEDV